jgi:hypothetical protein
MFSGHVLRWFQRGVYSCLARWLLKAALQWGFTVSWVLHLL